MALVAVLLLGAGCGDDLERVGDPVGNANPDAVSHSIVDADQVMVEGDLTVEQAEMVEWALSRFSLAGLRLPERLEFAFDPTRTNCSGALGRCDPDSGREIAGLWVCEPEGEET